MSLRGLTVHEIYARAVNGERRALGRLLSMVELGDQAADEITELVYRDSGNSHIVGVTGAPGAGKSTLTGQLARLLAEQAQRLAVLAVDPSSPLTGGAILGDRIRMDDLADETTFIRSMATRGHGGGLALAVPGAVRVFGAAGYDPIIIETVGVGQVEVDVAATADTTIVVVTPGWGDAVQANKAGLLEVADVFVVNKADRPGAKDARRDLELMLDLSHVSGQEDATGYRPPIVMTTATDGSGAPEVWAAVGAHHVHLEATGQLADRRERRVGAEIQSRVEQALGRRSAVAVASAPGQDVIQQAVERKLSPAGAARLLIQTIVGS